MPAPPEMELVSAEHGMNRVANAFYEEGAGICTAAGISPWDYCLAMVNAAAWILADSKDMPQDKAFERIEQFARVGKEAYLHRKHGSADSGHG